MVAQPTEIGGQSRLESCGLLLRQHGLSLQTAPTASIMVARRRVIIFSSTMLAVRGRAPGACDALSFWGSFGALQTTRVTRCRFGRRTSIRLDSPPGQVGHFSTLVSQAWNGRSDDDVRSP